MSIITLYVWANFLETKELSTYMYIEPFYQYLNYQYSVICGCSYVTSFVDVNHFYNVIENIKLLCVV